MFSLAVLINIFSSTLRIATPLLLGAMGELVAETAGVMNLGLEGTFLMAAFTSFWVTYTTGSLALGLMVAITTGLLMSLIFGLLCITLKLDQIVTGMALNILVSGISLYGYNLLVQQSKDLPTIKLLPIVKLPFLSGLPILGEIFFSQRALTYGAFLLVPAVWFLLRRTHCGLQLRSAGENPRAVDLRGLNVAGLQYLAIAFGGLLAGLAGAFITLGSSTRFVPEITAGRGWLAIVIVIAGGWHPWRTLIATLLFAFLDAFQLQLQGIGTQLPYQFLLALPYLLALVVLVASRARSPMPKWLGVPYIRNH